MGKHFVIVAGVRNLLWLGQIFTMSGHMHSLSRCLKTTMQSVRNRSQLHLVKCASGSQGQNFAADVQLYLRLANKLSLVTYLSTEDSEGFDCCGGFAIRVAMFQNDSFGASSGIAPVGTIGFYVDRFKISDEMFLGHS